MALELLGAPDPVAIALFVMAIPVGAWYFAQEGWEEFVEEREIGIEALMLIAAAGCIVFGLWEEAAALVFLYSLAEAIEELTFARTRSAIRDLLDLAPKHARRLTDGREEDMLAEDLQLGDVFLVRPGEALPTDGVIREGNSTLDEAPVTGESVPVEKGPGDAAYAGTVNGSRAIEVEVTRAYADNTLQRIVHLVEEAQSQKSGAQRFVDRFATRYTPLVLVGAALVALIGGSVSGDWTEWALRGVTVLVAGAPCALVMSVPVAAAAAISRAGREGILIKGGLQLEALGRVRAVAFDKTGTLTRGRPEVTDMILLAGDEREALTLAVSVEARSEHPLAQAVVTYTRERGIEPVAAREFHALVGHGASADINGRTVWVGSPQLVAERVGAAHLPSDVGRLQDEGKTVVFVGAEDQLLALLALRDEPRPEAAAAIAALRRLGVEHVSMLTGDNERTARAIAAQLGLDEVFAQLKPEDKVERISDLHTRFAAVAMVGDGINDAPALATADLGIAMGTGGNRRRHRSRRCRTDGRRPRKGRGSPHDRTPRHPNLPPEPCLQRRATRRTHPKRSHRTTHRRDRRRIPRSRRTTRRRQRSPRGTATNADSGTCMTSEALLLSKRSVGRWPNGRIRRSPYGVALLEQQRSSAQRAQRAP